MNPYRSSMTGYNEARYQQAAQAMQAKEAMAAEIAMLMVRYSFDLGGQSTEHWIDQWLDQYPVLWLHGAVVEALYQGRYKAVSVWQILDLWRRRGKPLRHFSHEFERMVSGRTLQLLFTTERPEPEIFSEPESSLTPGNAAALMPDQSEAPSLIVPSGALFGVQSQIQPYRPSQQFHLSLPGKISLTQSPVRAAYQPPIQQFIPTPEASEFHSKLKSIAQALIQANAQIISTTLATRKMRPADGEPAISPEPEQSTQ
jgi:hypothetical protein